MAAFTVIDHEELTGSVASWTSTTIPSSYDHLLLEVSARQDGSYHAVNCYFTVNGAVDYGNTNLTASTTTPASARAAGYDYIDVMHTPAASATADTFGAISVWIPNYANTANFKPMIMRAASENASTTDAQWNLALVAGLWNSTAAITSITLDAYGSDNFVQYSTFTLYGVTGA